MGLKFTKDKDINFNVSSPSKNHDSSQSQDNSISNKETKGNYFNYIEDNIKVDEIKTKMKRMSMANPNTSASEVKTVDKYSKRMSLPNTSATVNMEASLLKLIKKHNKDSEDKELIDSCLQKHFFFRILEKNAR